MVSCWLGIWPGGGDADAGTWGQGSRGTFRGSGAPIGLDWLDGAVQWTTRDHQVRNVRDPLRLLEQGPDRQRTPRCCSGGVSSIVGASESRCIHDGTARRPRQAPAGDSHLSSSAATGLHEAASWHQLQPLSGTCGAGSPGLEQPHGQLDRLDAALGAAFRSTPAGQLFSFLGSLG